MSLEELDAALRAAMDDDWDALPPAAQQMPARTQSHAPHHPTSEATQSHVALDDPVALDAALRAAMDDDWEGRQRPAAPTMAPPAPGPQHGRSQGYLTLPDAAAASLLGASVAPGGGDDDFYSLPPIDDGCYPSAPPDQMEEAAVPAHGSEQPARGPEP